MNGMRSWKRRASWTALIGGLVVFLLLAFLPLWFPWLLRPLAGRVGVVYQSYERHGYGHFILRGVRGQFGKTIVTAQRVQLFLPQRWLWGRFFQGPKNEFYVQVAQWSVEVGAGEAGS